MRLESKADEATFNRILDAAASMFAERGIEGVTMRALAERSNANLAAVSYHFGGKENLAVAVFRRVARESADLRMAALDVVLDLAEQEGRAPSVEEIVTVFVDAYVSTDEPRDGVLLSHFVLKHRANPTAWTNAVVKEELDTMAHRFINLLQQAAPHLSTKEVNWRYHMMVGATVLTLSDRGATNRINRLSSGLCSTAETNEMRDALVRFLTSSFITPDGETRAKSNS